MSTRIFSYTDEDWLLIFDEKVACTFSIYKEDVSDAAPRYYIERDQRIYNDMVGDSCNGPISQEDISEEVVEQVLQVIKNHPELQSCPLEIPSKYESGDLRDWFTFACDSFVVHVYGHYILDAGKRESKLPAEQRSPNYIVWRAFRDVKDVLAANGIDMQ